jgi:2',5'-phosphodiesterase
VSDIFRSNAPPKSGEKVGPSMEAVSKNTVKAGPGSCPFETRHLFTQNKLKDREFRVVSYNLLADYHADSDFSRTSLFPYCSAYALHIDYRKQLFLKEILGYNADLICLQEVDEKIFDLDLVPSLEERGLTGVHIKKGKTPEGLAVFWDTERFE